MGDVQAEEGNNCFEQLLALGLGNEISEFSGELDDHLDLVSADAGVTRSQPKAGLAGLASVGLHEASGAVVAAEGALIAEDCVHQALIHGNKLLVVATGAQVAGNFIEAGLALFRAGHAEPARVNIVPRAA